MIQSACLSCLQKLFRFCQRAVYLKILEVLVLDPVQSTPSLKTQAAPRTSLWEVRKIEQIFRGKLKSSTVIRVKLQVKLE